jgi:hypothetical protein
MGSVPATPDDLYASVAEEFLGASGVTQPSDPTRPRTGFGSSALRVDDRIFAMLVGGRLVVKLPRRRVEALIATGEGERFDPGHGRLMKEWVAVAPTAGDSWLPLAREALQFVASRR